MEEGEEEVRGGPGRRGVLHLLDGEIDNRRIFSTKKLFFVNLCGTRGRH